MAIIKCEKCGADYDNEITSQCPHCEEDVEAQTAQSAEAVQVEEAEIQASGSELENNCESEVAADDGEGVEDEALPAKNNKILTIIAIVLAVCVVGAVSWLIYTKTSGPKIAVAKTTISDVEKFGKENLNGTFTDSVSGTYYEFTLEKTEKEFEVESEEDESADSAADSAASQKEPEYRKETFDGKYTSGIKEDFIPGIVAQIYVEYNDKTEAYKEYKENKKLTDDDYLGFVEENDLSEEMKSFDESQQITSYYKTMNLSGFWKMDGGKIVLYDEAGGEGGVMIATSAGLTYETAMYKGEFRKGRNLGGLFVSRADSDAKETIRVYNDGYVVLQTEGQDGKEQLLGGTYELTGKGIDIEIGGKKSSLYITEDGIAACLFNK